MSENKPKNENMIKCHKLALAKIVRKKKINCLIYSHNCSMCEYGQSGLCELNNIRDNIIKQIKNGI
jgi:hypothetical protein